MNKYIWIGIVAVIILLIIGLIIYKSNNPSYTNPSSLDELKKAKDMGKSEYDNCLKEVETNEALELKCVVDKLKSKGYTDGINCIENFDNPICEPIKRYNAEVDATNECMEMYKGGLTIIDCTKLIGK